MLAGLDLRRTHLEGHRPLAGRFVPGFSVVLPSRRKRRLVIHVLGFSPTTAKIIPWVIGYIVYWNIMHAFCETQSSTSQGMKERPSHGEHS